MAILWGKIIKLKYENNIHLFITNLYQHVYDFRK